MTRTHTVHTHIGTSGWQYPHWSGAFYPEDLDKKEYFRFYRDRFNTVEINNSFYHLPSEKTMREWRKSAASAFLYSVKASRYITHMKKLKDPAEPVERFIERADILGDSLGVVLFQLPPRWGCNPERLGRFLDILPPGHRYAFEFRDRSWHTPEVFTLLESAGAAFCIYDFGGFTSPREVTADFVYIRLHGPGEPYADPYGTGDLSGWAGAVSSWLDTGRDVYCYFDNDRNGYAAKNARRLKRMLEGE